MTPSVVDSFYSRALPQAGYTITQNASGTSGGGSLAAIEFTGHGLKGSIGALSSLGIIFPGGGDIGITLTGQ